MSAAATKSSPTAFFFVLTTLKVVAVIGGLAGSVLSIMSLVGLITGNLWGQLVVALLIGVGVPLVAVERLSHDRRGQIQAGLASDMLALIWFGFALIFVVAAYPTTQALLIREADHLANGGAGQAASVVAYIARIDAPARPNDEAAESAQADADVSNDLAPEASTDDGGADNAMAEDSGIDASPDTIEEPEPIPSAELPLLHRGELTALLAPSLVTISTRRRDQTTRSGTGFIIDDDGLVATSTWVIDDAVSAVVRLADGTWIRDVSVVSRDNQHDLALLSIQTEQELQAVRLGETLDVVPGDRTTCMGNPLGLTLIADEGTVRTLSRWRGESWLIISTATTQRNVGGPVVTERGEVIGVAVIAPETRERSGSSARADQLGIAVPSSVVESLRQEPLAIPVILNRGSSRPLEW